MKKLLMITFIMVLIVVSRSTFSLGMGKIKVDSALDQPLEAYIELSLAENEIFEEMVVELASAEDYRKVGLDRSFVPSNIRVTKDEEFPVIRVSSIGPVSEPIISLVLDVSWENGKLLREYTILLDPPVFSESRSTLSQPVVESQPMVEEPMVEMTTEVVPNQDSYVEEVVSEPSNELVYEPEAVSGDEISVNSGDTLWSIASRNSYSNTSTHQMMMALYNANPSAFLNNNINELSKGAKLRIPSRDEVTAITNSEAIAEFKQHQSAWSPAVNNLSSFQQQTTSYEEDTSEPELDYGVELVGGDDTESSAGSENGDENLDTDVIQLEEELTSKASENDELAERVNELEEIVEQQQAALEIQDDDLATLQNLDAPDETTDAADNADDVWGEDIAATVENNVDEAVDDASDAINDLLDSESSEPVVDTTVEKEAATEAEAAVAEPIKPVTKSAAKEQSFIDKTLSWVKDNLLYVGLGLLGLIILLFVPKMLRSGGDDYDEEGGNFLDDIKSERSRKSEFNEADETADTKLNQPLLDNDETDNDAFETTEDSLLDTVVDEADELKEDAAESIDELINLNEEDEVTAEIEPLAEDEDEFDLDEFLSQDDEDDASATDEEPTRLDLETVETVESVDDELDLSETLQDIQNESDDALDDLEIDMDSDLDIDGDETLESSEANDLSDDIDTLDELDLDLDDFSDDAISADDNELDIDLDPEMEDLSDDLDIEGDDLSISLDDDLESDLQDFDEELELDDIQADEPADDSLEEDLNSGVDLDDMMSEEDSIETKLDLARAYLGMGENEGASSLLDEVIEEGNDEQKQEAQSLKDNIPD